MKRDAALDRLLGLTLKTGAYLSFGCIVTGLSLRFVGSFADRITIAGFLILLATPGLRIVVAGIQFLRERDFKYAAVSAGVFAIMLLAFVLGIRM
ncbi:MAG TPA: DUF1634 domain-containing protein [Candidatus Angelobacter sp.]|nr:DUF1634 domain-containing protein [Candidatus Angelobacter sp.]